MADEEGLQIDLDKGEGLVTKGQIYDFIAHPCTRLDIEFHCKELLLFHPNDNNYFRYLTLEWIPLTCNFGHTSEGTWWYKIEALPKQMFKFIEKPCPDLQTLATVMDVELGDGSVNLPIKCPVIGLPAYAFIRTIRLQSYNDAAIKRQMGESYFIYCNSHTLTAMTWETLTKSKANSLELPEGLNGTDQVLIYDSRVENYLATPAYPREWTEEDWLRRFNGVTYEFKTLKPAAFAEMYTIKFANIDQMDSPESMLCFYTQCDIMNLNKMTNRFAQICFE
jgi:hypothetical protein